MDKRFTRQATLYSILFLVMLIFAVTAFFYGLHLGKEKTEEKYANLTELKVQANSNYEYQQQDLISFYLTIYSPYREFQNEWFSTLDKLTTNKVSNPSSILNELSSQASKFAEQAADHNMQGYGLLGTSQQNYIRSLQQFEKAAKNVGSKADGKSTEELLQLLENDENYKTAISEALLGQQNYFDTMYSWAASIDLEIPQSYDSSISQSVTNWSGYPLIIKNNIIASYVSEMKYYSDVLPHDIVGSIDHLIESGQTNSMNLQTIEQILQLLLNTSAVRSGDYHKYSGKYYEDEFLPQIPFFYPNIN